MHRNPKLYESKSKHFARGLNDDFDQTIIERVQKPSGWNYKPENNNDIGGRVQWHRDNDESVITQLINEEHEWFPVTNEEPLLAQDGDIRTYYSGAIHERGKTKTVADSFTNVMDRYPGVYETDVTFGTEQFQWYRPSLEWDYYK